MSLAARAWERWRATRPADRVRCFGLVAVALVAAGLVVAARVHPTAPDSRAELNRIGAQLDAADPWEPRAEADDGGTVEVVEQGYAPVPKSERRDAVYAVGFVLENTSRTDAVIPNVDITVLDGDGDVLAFEGSGGLENETIPPGARLGVADSIYLAEDADVTVTVSIGRSEWYPARVDIGAITTTRVEPHGDARLTVHIDSDYDTAILAPTVYVLFRDAEGRLRGGQALVDGFEPVPPGRSRHELDFQHPPPKGSDLDATEVHVSYNRTVITF